MRQSFYNNSESHIIGVEVSKKGVLSAFLQNGDTVFSFLLACLEFIFYVYVPYLNHEKHEIYPQNAKLKSR